MKTHAIKTAVGDYLKWNKSSPIGWRPGRTQFTDDPSEAKHYKAIGSAKGIITQAKNHAVGSLERHITNLKEYKEPKNDPNTNKLGNTLIRYYHNRHDKKYYEEIVEAYKEHVEFINGLVVVEIDVEKPNYGGDTTKERRFERYGIGFTAKASGGGNHCRCCGMYLKQLPIILFGTRKPGKVCPWCVIEHAHDATKMIEEMDQTERESAEADRFINMMG
jgi:hypothetical protein